MVRQKWPDFTAISQPAGKAQPPGSSPLRVAARLRFELGLEPLYGLAGGRIEYWMRPQELPGRPAIRIDGDWLTLLSGGVAASIPRFIALELLGGSALRGGFLASFWQRAVIAVLRIERVVYFALEVAGAMKPRSNADEYAAIEPFRAVVAVGNAVIGGVIVVAVGAIRGDADFDRDLSLCFGSSCYKEDSRNSR